MVDTKALLENAVERARARAAAMLEAQEQKEAADAKAKVESWQHQLEARREAERQARDKAGMDIAEDFIKEISGPFQRFATRDDAAKKLGNIEIILRPGKSDQSAAHSIQLRCSGTSPRVWHRASIESLTLNQEVQLSRLREKGGIISTSPVEMAQEILRLRETLMKVNDIIQNVQGEEAGKARDIINTLGLTETS